MLRLVVLSMVFLMAVVSYGQVHADDSPRLWEPIYRKTRDTENTPGSLFKEVLQRISSGKSDSSDDSILVRLVKKMIIETAARIKNPSTSLEIGAETAQNLVADLTSAYTSAISNSSSVENAKRTFARFQDAVQEIVEFAKNGQFVT